MLSREMYLFLRQINRYPRKSEFREISWSQEDRNVLKGIIQEAIEYGYIRVRSGSPIPLEEQWWVITEKGAAEVTEFEMKYLRKLKKLDKVQGVGQVNTLLAFFNNCKALLGNLFSAK